MGDGEGPIPVQVHGARDALQGGGRAGGEHEVGIAREAFDFSDFDVRFWDGRDLTVVQELDLGQDWIDQPVGAGSLVGEAETTPSPKNLNQNQNKIKGKRN